MKTKVKTGMSSGKSRKSGKSTMITPGTDASVKEHEKEALETKNHASGKAPILPGSARGEILYIAEDFDEPLSDFEDYT